MFWVRTGRTRIRILEIIKLRIPADPDLEHYIRTAYRKGSYFGIIKIIYGRSRHLGTLVEKNDLVYLFFTASYKIISGNYTFFLLGIGVSSRYVFSRYSSFMSLLFVFLFSFKYLRHMQLFYCTPVEYLS